MKNIAKTSHHHECNTSRQCSPKCKKSGHLGCCLSPMAKDLSSVCVHIPEHTRSFNRQAYTNLKISTVR